MTKMIKIEKNTIKPIKPFKTLEEEANFWDTHDITDEINEGTLIGFHQANKTDIISIRLEPKVVENLRRQAFKKGVGPTTLARMWIMEKLQSL